MHNTTLYYGAGGFAVFATITAVYIYWTKQSTDDYNGTEHLEKAMDALD